MSLTLTEAERRMLHEGSEGIRMAMRIVSSAAELLGARELVEIRSAHIDGCLHHGDGGVEFAEALRDGGGEVTVPTTLNVGALDLLHPERVRADPSVAAMARRQMDAYVAMGAQPTFTCAPYQVGHEPGLGEQVAWGESNAIAFVNSVLGARTERYGDFLDACCALVGRAPYYGLHDPQNRMAEVVVDVTAVPRTLAAEDVFFPVFGHWLGRAVGGRIAAIDGLPVDTTRDQLKALGAAAASSGSVALFHVVGVTPEAPELAAVLPEPGDVVRLPVPAAELRDAFSHLSTTDATRIDAVAVGSPHFSVEEFADLYRLLEGVSLTVPFYVCTARDTLADVEARGWVERLVGAGVEIVVDTCVVVTPILPSTDGVLMTNSGKFAHYGPANTGYDVVYGSLAECVASAREGTVTRDEAVWSW